MPFHHFQFSAMPARAKLTLFVCLVGVNFMTACKTKAPEAVPRIAVSDSSIAANSAPVPHRDPVFDDRYLQRQALRARDTRATLDSLKVARGVDKEEIRKFVLRRKGEIIFALKDIRKNSMLSEQVRDSLAAPLDSEAIELAEELVHLDK